MDTVTHYPGWAVVKPIVLRLAVAKLPLFLALEDEPRAPLPDYRISNKGKM